MRALQKAAGAAIGAALGFSLSVAGAQPTPAAGAKLISVSFASSDLDRSVAFYTKVLGLTQTRVIEYPTEKKIRMDFPGGGAGLLLIKPKSAAGVSVGPRIGRMNLEVPDLRGVEARLASMGYHLSSGIIESKEYHVLSAVAADPDGNELEMVQRLP
jgi:catechol 2,3-dioxygenase-like lactoylglutathione lyase family enzyme